MFSKWFDEAKKKTQQALEAATEIVTETAKVAAEKANQISQTAGEKISDIFIKMPDDFTYMTDNLIAMGFPGLPKKPIQGRNYNNPSYVAMYLQNHHLGHFKIFNLSDESYDYHIFDNSVVEYSFNGSPCPPLGIMIHICQEIDDYLKQDEKNVAVIHCVSGVGRTITMCAAYLGYSGLYDTCVSALSYCVEKRNIQMSEIMPSQLQYLQYMDQLLLSINIPMSPLLLKKIILKCPPLLEEEGFRPIYDIYINGKLSYITNDGKKLSEVSYINKELKLSEQELDIPVKGDIMIRCRHLDSTNKLRTVFLFVFHTGFIKLFSLQLTKAMMDFACNNTKINDDFEVVVQFDSLHDVSEFQDTEKYSELIAGKDSFWGDVSKKRQERKNNKEKNAFTIGKNPYKKADETPKLDSRNYLNEISELENQLKMSTTSTEEPLPATETNDLDALMKEMNMLTGGDEGDVNMDIDINEIDQALHNSEADIPADIDGFDSIEDIAKSMDDLVNSNVDTTIDINTNNNNNNETTGNSEKAIENDAETTEN